MDISAIMLIILSNLLIRGASRLLDINKGHCGNGLFKNIILDSLKHCILQPLVAGNYIINQIIHLCKIKFNIIISSATAVSLSASFPEGLIGHVSSNEV